ncbi:uncharacterized protein LOC111354394 [Spodoptera litura]|uniref:Uncharacterized protein LOC111354394 n=1 Tax=Spodoptera litura TaxID=69820 RepID=A0A9J7IRU7_SPOLT|nr:uncharacterized protein LOC111354394 [Spodoptera litura]
MQLLEQELPILAYLAGMGDFTDATGVKHYLTAREPNENGHFGAVDHMTHRDYETLISPALSITRVLSDVASTHNRGGDFQMPDGILPREQFEHERAQARMPARQPDVEVPPPDDDDVAEGIEEEVVEEQVPVHQRQ